MGLNLGGLGAFASGIAQGIQQGQAAKANRDMMELQKKELDAKIKAQDAADEMKKQKFSMMMAALAGGQPGAAGASMPTMPGYTSGSTYTPGPPMAPVAPVQQQSQGGGIVNLIAKLQNDPLLRGYMKQELGGIDLAEVHPRTIADENGRPITQYFDSTGRPIPGLTYKEPVKAESIRSTGSKGEETTTFYDPYNPPQSTMQTKAGTGKDATKSMYKANIEKQGIPALDNMVKNMFTKDKDGNIKLTWAARIQGTSPDLSQKAGGEIANDAMKLAYSLLRPESGAAISNDELRTKINAQLPKMFTNDKYALDQFRAIGDVIDTYLSDIDPEYKPVARQLIDERLGKMKSSTSGLGKTPKIQKKSSAESEADAYLQGLGVGR